MRLCTSSTPGGFVLVALLQALYWSHYCRLCTGSAPGGFVLVAAGAVSYTHLRAHETEADL
eukprot:837065-Rhodomonas_salina.1